MTRLISFRSSSSNSSPATSPKDNRDEDANSIISDSFFPWMRGSKKVPLTRSRSGGRLDVVREKKQSIYDEAGAKMLRGAKTADDLYTCCGRKDVYYYFNLSSHWEGAGNSERRSGLSMIRLPVLNLFSFK
mmetsp:Transcript_30012/g.67905  ORF Transcript_30012/g.67905 Transcript_30012/m.67905 type:complete len:131 (+) Transcript_30012:306-698(+)|eukprot:752363-Hanusia_phi.AAC.1